MGIMTRLKIGLSMSIFITVFNKFDGMRIRGTLLLVRGIVSELSSLKIEQT